LNDHLVRARFASLSCRNLPRRRRQERSVLAPLELQPLPLHPKLWKTGNTATRLSPADASV
jgi:hypothetical protein